MTTNKGTDQDVTRKEHDINREAKRVIGTDPFGGLITEGNLSVQIDSFDANTTYIGQSQIGVATSVPEWQIIKIVKSGSNTGVFWANGSDSFTNIWDDRVTISYN